MASWIVHLRVADCLLDKLDGISDTEFVIGNIAPDSGVPNEDGYTFVPSSEVSHFRTTDKYGLKEIHEEWYISKYFTRELREHYDRKQYSFYLGYLTHLLTDKLWVRDIVQSARQKFLDLYKKDGGVWAKKVKGEWHILDVEYLQRHPNFRAFILYEKAVGFRNVYLDFFSKDAFDNRREYITTTFRRECESLQSKETYLSEEEVADFVCHAVEEICERIQLL